MEVKKLSDFLTTDLVEMRNTLDYITQNYDSSLAFFQSIAENLNGLKDVYKGYKLDYLVYAGIGVVGLLLALKLISFFVRIVQCYPAAKEYITDWSEFKAQCQNLRIERMEYFKKALPLVPIVRSGMSCDVTP